MLFSHVRPEMSLYQDEIFGPVPGVVRVHSLAWALRLLNECGNGASIFTTGCDTAREFVRRVQAGKAGIKVFTPTAYISAFRTAKLAA